MELKMELKTVWVAIRLCYLDNKLTLTYFLWPLALIGRTALLRTEHLVGGNDGALA